MVPPRNADLFNTLEHIFWLAVIGAAGLGLLTLTGIVGLGMLIYAHMG